MSDRTSLVKIRAPNPAGFNARVNGTSKRSFVMHNRLGLHCRAATCLAETLSRYNATVKVSNGEAISDGRNVLGLLSLAAGYGTTLDFSATGNDAEPVLDAVQKLFETDFAVAYIEA